MKPRKEYEAYLADQRTPDHPVDLSEETLIRATLATNNTNLVIAELLLDIRDLLTKKENQF